MEEKHPLKHMWDALNAAHSEGNVCHSEFYETHGRAELTKEIDRLEKALAMSDQMWMAERAQRKNLEQKLAEVADCAKCHRIKRALCFVACPAVEERLQG